MQRRRRMMIRSAKLHRSSKSERGSLLRQILDGVLHLREVDFGFGIVRDVGDLAVLVDEEAYTMGHVFAEDAHSIFIGNLAVGVGNEREVKALVGDEFLVARGGIKTDADDMD